jgi:hypothetical protein
VIGDAPRPRAWDASCRICSARQRTREHTDTAWEVTGTRLLREKERHGRATSGGTHRRALLEIHDALLHQLPLDFESLAALNRRLSQHSLQEREPVSETSHKHRFPSSQPVRHAHCRTA